MEATVTPATSAVAQLLGDLPVRLAGPAPPGLLGVVAEQVGLGRHHAVRHAAARHDLALLVHGHRLDRCGADVDADGDVVGMGAHESDTGVMITSLWTTPALEGESYAHDIAPPEGPRDRRGQRTRSRPVARAGGSRARLLARPAQPAHLQRRAAGGTGSGRGGQHRGRRERFLRPGPVRTTDHRRLQLPGRPDQRRRPGRHRSGRPRAAGARPERRCGGRAGRGLALRRHPRHRPRRP